MGYSPIDIRSYKQTIRGAPIDLLMSHKRQMESLSARMDENDPRYVELLGKCQALKDEVEFRNGKKQRPTEFKIDLFNVYVLWVLFFVNFFLVVLPPYTIWQFVNAVAAVLLGTALWYKYGLKLTYNKGSLSFSRNASGDQ